MNNLRNVSIHSAESSSVVYFFSNDCAHLRRVCIALDSMMKTANRFAYIALYLGIHACAGGGAAQPPVRPAPHDVSLSPEAVEPKPPTTESPKPRIIRAPKPLPPDPKVVDQAIGMLRKGRDHYRQGEYAAAELALKQAMALYPFLAEANLIMGKVLLIKGSATRDRALLNGARLMFEMASAMDPELREAKLLIQLVKNAPLE